MCRNKWNRTNFRPQEINQHNTSHPLYFIIKFNNIGFPLKGIIDQLFRLHWQMFLIEMNILYQRKDTLIEYVRTGVVIRARYGRNQIMMPDLSLV